MLTGSTIEAARTLNVSQPAVSKTLSELEGQIGATLFMRTGAGLVPTPKAEWLFDASQETLAKVDYLDAILRDVDNMPQRPIRLSANSAMAHSILPDALRGFREDFPDIVISLDVVARRDNRRWINAQDFDLAVTMLPIEYPADLITHLPTSSAVCIIPAHHHLRDEERITLSMLATEPLVVLQPHNLTRYKVEQAFNASKLPFDIALETGTAASLVMFVSSGLGCGIIDPFTAAKLAPLGCVVKPLDPNIDLSFGILRPIRALARPEIQTLAAYIERAYHDAYDSV